MVVREKNAELVVTMDFVYTTVCHVLNDLACVLMCANEIRFRSVPETWLRVRKVQKPAEKHR